MRWAEEKTLEKFIDKKVIVPTQPMLFSNFPTNLHSLVASKYTILREAPSSPNMSGGSTIISIAGSGWLIGCWAKAEWYNAPSSATEQSMSSMTTIIIDGVEEHWLSPSAWENVTISDFIGSTPISRSAKGEMVYSPDLLTVNKDLSAQGWNGKTETRYINGPIRFDTSFLANWSYNANLSVSNTSARVEGGVYYILDPRGGS